MDEKDWLQLRGLFDKVCDLPPGRWRPELERTTEDPLLVDQVLGLLQAQTLPMRRAGTSVANVLARAADTEVAAGDQLGSWRLTERLGEGGMGTVFLARRADELYEQQVAIKLLHGLPDPAVAQQLAEERKLLAGMQHPNIARLYDGGTTPAGHPYLVMEYVDGLRLGEYCVQRRPGLAARLRLFVRICRAVQAAHAKLVVHCDLKPGNVLVRGDGEPVLLDFGIARLVGSVGQAGRSRFCTPAYASPEMLEGGVVGVASDVFSLGVMFVELVSGQQLHRGASDARHEVPLPSRRAMTGHAWRRRLRGDLDAIAARACALDPGNRYGSVEAMADDVERYFRQLPVRARSGSRLYRTGCLLRRRWKGACVATFVAVLMLGFIVHLIDANARAEEEKVVATQAMDFLVSLFQAADPDRRPMGEEEASARQVLDAGAARIESELANAPAQLSRLRMALGQAYQNMGVMPEAEELLRQAARGMLDPDVGRPEQAVAALADLSILLSNGQRGEEALEVGENALALLEEREQGELRAHALSAMGQALMQLQRHDEAEAMFGQALEIIDRLPPESMPARLGTLKHNFGVLQNAKGEYVRAEASLREALDVKRSSAGSGPDYQDSLQALGYALVHQGRLREAAVLLQENLRLADEIYGGHSIYTAVAHNELASLYHQMEEFELAATGYAQALELIAGVEGTDSVVYAICMSNLATLEERRGDLDAAERLYWEAMGTLRAALGPDAPNSLRTEANLGRLLTRMGRLDEAEPMISRSVEAWSRTLPADAPDMLMSRLGMVEWNILAGEYENARRLLEHLDPGDGWPSPDLELRQQALWAQLAQRSGQAVLAVELWQAVVEATTARNGPESISTAEARISLAESLLDAGSPDEAARQAKMAGPAVRERVLPRSGVARRLGLVFDAVGWPAGQGG